jgi:predicted permease
VTLLENTYQKTVYIRIIYDTIAIFLLIYEQILNKYFIIVSKRRFINMNINLLASSNIGEALALGLAPDAKLWTNIAKTIIFILLGFIFTKKKWLPENTGKILTRFVMAICLPCLAFCAFMSNFTIDGAIDTVVNLILGFVLYVAFIFIGKLIFIWVKDKKRRTVLSVLFAFGSTTFFAYPLITSIYGSQAGNNFNVMNIAYRVFLYSYAYIAIASLQETTGEDGATATKTDLKSILKKVFLNPIVIATFAGLFLWLLQAIPGSATVRTDWLNPKDIPAEQIKYVAFWRFDVTLPWIYQAANTLGGLSSTIILVAIGCTLGSQNFKEAITDKYAWIWTGLKVIVAPLIVLALLFIIQAISNGAGWALNDAGVSKIISMNTVNSAVLTWMVSPATVAVGYCIAYDQEKQMASHISLIGTLGAVVGVILWVIVLTIIGATGFFAA